MELTHLNQKGEARMVDISKKEVTKRTAIAYAAVYMKSETLNTIGQGTLPKGDVFAAARIAGIMAAKRTPELIPLCHSLPLESLEITFELNKAKDCVEITSRAQCSYKTGAEMEALLGASVASLTVYDMCKCIDKSMVISEIKLLKKTGGKSGDFERQ